MSSYSILKHLRLVLPQASRSLVRRFSSSAPENVSERLKAIPIDRIRNFCIIAHVDHGKSTLADRLLEKAGLKVDRPQILDSLQVEKERGITVKAQTVSLFYTHNNQDYLLNLIDTPGHVDFSNEVHRSLAPCDGAILLVDANHGIQAQTVSNYFMASSRNLKILPILNKIDLKNANPEKVCEDLNSMFDIDPESVLKISAKLGVGVEKVIPGVIEHLPAPKTSDPEAPFRALLFDSSYDRYRGALSLINVREGEIKIGQEITAMSTGKVYEVKTLSLLTPVEVPVERLTAGQVGLLGCNMRSGKEALIGDTIHLKGAKVTQLPGFRPQQAMVFAGIYPPDQSKYTSLRAAIEKLTLNDSAVTVTPDSNSALGQGWRLGFLGLLHMEVFSQRLEQEYDAEPIITAPSVTYKVKLKGSKTIKAYGGEEITVSNPALLPDTQNIEEFREPTILATIITPTDYIGSVIGLCVERRGTQKTSTHIDSDRVMMTYTFPLAEIVLDFYDRLKSLTSGYASFDYEDHGYEVTNVVKLRILLNGQEVEELSTIVHFSKAEKYARHLVLKLKDIIPRQMVHIAIQAAVGGKILARETIKAYRKDVTAKLYGGDVTRRMKLLKQQAEGKKKMRAIANISIPRDTFISILKR